MGKNLVVIPTYNELGNIREIIQADFDLGLDIDILIVDDNSKDGTGEVVDELIASNKYNGRLHVMHRAGKLGLGTAYIQGFEWGLEKGYEVFISQDADFSHDPKYIKTMLEDIKTNDLVIGSRYVKGGAVKNWGLIRRMISLGGSIYARTLLLTRVRDLTGGYNCYSKKALGKINLKSIVSNGYCFQIEMKWRCALGKLKIKETPIVFEDRRVGQSKMSKKIFIEALLKVFVMGFSRKKFRSMLGN
ncbi:MAG: polyprenol monophosphomannose synthase [Alphaproteobacteria bacterium]|jgi:dolichol-phosphate mannosyltransferase|nr:polyprenol monophosphomannose synthase [Alphaproteobacteria bacterium]